MLRPPLHYRSGVDNSYFLNPPISKKRPSSRLICGKMRFGKEIKMTKLKEPELDPREQFKKIKETAKELGAEKDTESIDRAYWRMARKIKKVSITKP